VLKKALADTQFELGQLKEKMQSAPSASDDGKSIEDPPDGPTFHFTESTSIDPKALWAAVRKEALKDSGVLAVLSRRPEIAVNVQRRVVELSDETLQGKLALLIAEGFFDAGANANQAFMELKRRGAAVSVPNVYRELDGLTAMGFLVKEKNGKNTAYHRVEGMKVTRKEITV